MKINRQTTNHNFEKQNLVTLQDRKGMYDLYTCTACGLTGKSYNLTEITISERFKSASETCPKAPKAKQIKITTGIHATGRQFANLIPGTVHDVVATPKDDSGRLAGVWVMGVGEPVKVLVGEYEYEKES